MPTSKMNPTAKNLSEQEYETASLIGLPSLETLEAPILDHLPGWWTSLLRDSPVSHTVQQESDVVPKTSATSGPTPSEPFLRWDPGMSCWRTFQGFFNLQGEAQPMGAPYLDSLPTRGMCADGIMWELGKSEPHIEETDGGALQSWPTPDAGVSTRVNRSNSPHAAPRPLLARLVQSWPTPQVNDLPNKNANTKQWGGLNSLTSMAEQTKWPTPTQRDHKDGRASQQTLDKNSCPLNEIAVYHHSLQDQESEEHGEESVSSGPDSLQPWQTPSEAMTHGGNLSRGQDRKDEPLFRGQVKKLTGSSKLNPSFVEWLMGLPIGWTDLKPLAMVSYRQWWQSFSGGLHGPLGV